MALSSAGYQPMGDGPRPARRKSRPTRSAEGRPVAPSVAGTTSMIDFDRTMPTQAADRCARSQRLYGPRLQQLGFAPRPGEPADRCRCFADADRHCSASIAIPAVLAEAKRLFAAWQTNPDAIPGSLKADLAAASSRAMPMPATWDALHATAAAPTTGDGRAHVALPAARRARRTKRWRAARSISRSPTSRARRSAPG